MILAAPVSRVSVLVRGARALLLVGATAALVSCSMLDDFQAPWEGEKYKMKIEPDVPASKAYDQGLAQLANGAPADAAKKFTDLGEKFPDSDWARKGLLMTTYAQYEAATSTAPKRRRSDMSSSIPSRKKRLTRCISRRVRTTGRFLTSRATRSAPARRLSPSSRWSRTIPTPSTSKTRSTRFR
jgi:hypothetical protein